MLWILSMNINVLKTNKYASQQISTNIEPTFLHAIFSEHTKITVPTTALKFHSKNRWKLLFSTSNQTERKVKCILSTQKKVAINFYPQQWNNTSALSKTTRMTTMTTTTREFNTT